MDYNGIDLFFKLFLIRRNRNFIWKFIIFILKMLFF